MGRVICCGSALRFFGRLVRTIDILNFHQIIGGDFSYGWKFSAGTWSCFSFESHGLLLATSYPSGQESAKSSLNTLDNGEYGDIDSSKTLKYISGEIDKITELLYKAEPSAELRLFR